jgi:hypothetical protein
MFARRGETHTLCMRGPPPPGGRKPAGATWLTLPAAAGLVLATPVAAWWIVGPQDSAGFAPADLDYAIRPFRITPAAERAVGAGSVVLAVVTALLLGWATLRRRFDPRWWRVLGALLIVGVLIGWSWRVLTAGVIGANIGAGMVILLIGPLVVFLLAFAVWRSLRLVSPSAHGAAPPAPPQSRQEGKPH